MTTKPLTKLKLGTAFQMETDGPVFIKCRGGFRPGCGGQLHACRPDLPVIPYTGMIWPQTEIDAALAFKARWTLKRCRQRNYRNWKDALLAAWHQGWDDREPCGGLLRSFRNSGGHIWLDMQPIR